ncbi:MAG: hypothetical protein II749_05995 [Clostridia bacterium]|nr:hypothetical protein [Clostridia bacterium]
MFSGARRVISFIVALLLMLSLSGCFGGFTPDPGQTDPPEDISDITDPSEDMDDPDDGSDEPDSSYEGSDIDVPDTDVKIVPSESSQVKYTRFDNGLVSFDVPAGWTIQVPDVGYISYTFKVFDPKNEDRMFIFCLKFTGFMKTEKARRLWQDLYPATFYSKLTPVDPQTTEQFYRVWTENAKLVNEEQIVYPYFPYIYDMNTLETIGKAPMGGDVLRVTFKNEEGRLMQGLFTSTIYDPGPYYMYGEDVAQLSALHNFMLMAPEEEFNDWQAVMDHCIGTIQFSDAFMEGYNREQDIVVSIVRANQKIFDEMSGMIMDSWEKRNTSYDIISQKRSDATLGYERVYDVETGKIYRAYNGFLDDYRGNRYKAVTDEMYSYTIDGYIVK